MPHIVNGPRHSCPGKSGPVTIRNKSGTVKSTIEAGNCRIASPAWCTVHEHYCKLHDWAFSKKDECALCARAKKARQDAWEATKHRKKSGSQDEGEGGVGRLEKAAPNKTAVANTKKTVQRLKEERKKKKSPAEGSPAKNEIAGEGGENRDRCERTSG
ncbi:unnamed protein product [Diplocarpon coronariae]|uniref:Uncharacterized protein n=1 Tax=Diplocarpon coronariae TaxID=2795749 RepID=A0A218YX74_9HELO|nr:hypothetical protein JHW43_009303 [Diplocarpon mali]OWP00278.1 hypothetical protein B2J93_3804 [Marssonina coronariae]